MFCAYRAWRCDRRGHDPEVIHYSGWARETRMVMGTDQTVVVNRPEIVDRIATVCKRCGEDVETLTPPPKQGR